MEWNIHKMAFSLMGRGHWNGRGWYCVPFKTNILLLLSLASAAHPFQWMDRPGLPCLYWPVGAQRQWWQRLALEARPSVWVYAPCLIIKHKQSGAFWTPLAAIGGGLSIIHVEGMKQWWHNRGLFSIAGNTPEIAILLDWLYCCLLTMKFMRSWKPSDELALTLYTSCLVHQ